MNIKSKCEGLPRAALPGLCSGPRRWGSWGFHVYEKEICEGLESTELKTEYHKEPLWEGGSVSVLMCIIS